MFSRGQAPGPEQPDQPSYIACSVDCCARTLLPTKKTDILHYRELVCVGDGMRRRLAGTQSSVVQEALQAVIVTKDVRARQEIVEEESSPRRRRFIQRHGQ